MKFDFKQVKVPPRAAKRLPQEVTNARAYKVRQAAGRTGDSGDVLGLVIGSDLAGKPGWSTYYDNVLSGGFGTRQLAAESLVQS